MCGGGGGGGGVVDTPRWAGTSGQHGTESRGPLVTLNFVCNEGVLFRGRGPGIHSAHSSTRVDEGRKSGTLVATKTK